MKINIDLFSKNSISNAIKQIADYQSNLIRKTEIFVQKLCEIGIPVIEQKISLAESQASDTTHTTDFIIETHGSSVKGTLFVEGEQVCFIEFGTGIYYNGGVGASPHPKGNDLNMRIGEYNGQKYSKGQYGTWVYKNDADEVVFTHGIKATMPVLSARDKIILDVTRIYREVFGKD